MNENLTWCKENVVEGVHTLEFPPVNKQIPDGSWIINYNLNPEAMTADGFTQWTDEQLEEWHRQYDPKPVITVKDYDDALEAHLLAERTERGYTTREPDTYINSSVARWKQDALDWVAHKDTVMLYGLQVENDYEAGRPVPTLEEFKDALPKIQWTLTISE